MNDTSAEIKELQKQFDECRDTATIEEMNSLIDKALTISKGRNFGVELYRYCRTNHPDLCKCMRWFSKRMNHVKSDNHVAVEGITGSGKSTLSLCMTAILCAMQRKRFDFGRHVMYMPKEQEMSGRLKQLQFKDILWVDETIMSLNRAKWQNKDSIRSSETVQTERFRRNTIFYCIPSFHELTKSFRNVNIKFRLWVIPRFAAILRVKDVDSDLAGSDPWHTDHNIKYKKLKRISVLSTAEERLYVERKLPNFAMDFTWPDLENIPHFSIYALTYEMYKWRSRLIAAKVPDQSAKPMSREEELADARLAVIKSMMRKAIARGIRKFSVFRKEFMDDDVPVSLTTLRKYWKETFEGIRVPIPEESQGNAANTPTANNVVKFDKRDGTIKLLET